MLSKNEEVFTCHANAWDARYHAGKGVDKPELTHHTRLGAALLAGSPLPPAPQRMLRAPCLPRPLPLLAPVPPALLPATVSSLAPADG